MISALISGVLSWLSSILFGWMKSAEDKAQGRKDQAADDTAATADADRKAKTIDDADSRLSDDELNRRLRS